MRRVYVTGARGMLGKALVPLLEKKYEVKATDLPEADITDRDNIVSDIRSFSPDYVFHLASMTDVDLCELHPEQARLSNTTGTRNVAEGAKETGAMMIYISTGMIYNGRKKGPYTEYDLPDPVNVYGRTKYEGELEIGRLLKRYFIFNTCWIFGGGKEDKKFVSKILELAGKNKKLKIVDDRIGSPTYTVDFARAIADLIEQNEYGRFHCVNSGLASRFQLAEKILQIAGITGCSLTPVSSDEFPLPAPRPEMEGMSNYRLTLMGLDNMRPWDEALSEYIREVLI
ncbi:MAG: dTDP-4-dehydrorhamnose reductase [Candidatus Krumholzibacteriota bacterium]|nr:dTDP-4-dehydrorhamnose reductase [Candidatus Krumholzibacteriota bacterium]